MGGDYTRFSDRPRRRYSSVLMQQGRVQLDADWNEQVEIARRRWETQALDTFGGCAVPKAATPNGFQLTAAGSPLTLQIGVGRLYAGGMLAEVFPGESYTYDQQPYYPAPPQLSGMSGPNGIAYLDVWQRELTAIEDSDLLEKALGGPDTTTRLQTVWQVKVQPTGDKPATCVVNIPPSAGRLSSHAVAPPASNDPCILSPTGGYRGLENRLYRVEIHRGATLTTAKFKWSRENGSVVSAVKQISTSGGQSRLVVSRIGRDQVLRFRVDDWVEVLDDHRELMDEPGEMARVIDVSEAKLTITLDRAIPAAGGRPFGATSTEIEARHTRLRRWDQRLNVDAEGLLNVSTAWVPLEDGVEVRFALDPATGQFRGGDYWAFAARTAEASVEELVTAPPRGILHHYCPLATLAGLGPGAQLSVVSECRTLWPPSAGESCCTVVVHPGESIQAALDSLPPEGGCVCLKPGVHDIEAEVFIRKSNVTLHGETVGAIVRRAMGTTCLRVTSLGATERVHHVRVESIHFVATPNPNVDLITPIVHIDRVGEVTLRDCILTAKLPIPDDPSRGAALGVLVFVADRILLERNSIEGAIFGIRASGGEALEVVGNRVIAPQFELNEAMTPLGDAGIDLDEKVMPHCRIELNLVDQYVRGIRVGEMARDTRVADNLVFVRPVRTDESEPDRLYAIRVDAESCRVAENSVFNESPTSTAIVATADSIAIERNQIHAGGPRDRGSVSTGILVAAPGGNDGPPPDHCTILGNLLTGPHLAVIVFGANETTVAENLILSPRRSDLTFGIALNGCSRAAIRENLITDAQFSLRSTGGGSNRFIQNDIRAGLAGLLLEKETGVTFSCNHVEDMRGPGFWGRSLSAETTLVENSFRYCGSDTDLSLPAIAVLLDQVPGHLRVESCDVLETGWSPSGVQNPNAAQGIVGTRIHSAAILGNRIASPRNAPEFEFRLDDRALVLICLEHSGPMGALISGNTFAGPALPRLVEVFRFRMITFTTNICDHFIPPNISDNQVTDPATVALDGERIIAVGSHVDSGVTWYPSIDFYAQSRVSAVSNITSGSLVRISGPGPTPAPAVNFNIII
jgi:hypothetical protein